MSSSDRRAFLAGSALCLAGCGYTPAYGPGASAEALRGSIRMDAPVDTTGFALVRALEARLGLPEAPVYAMSADIRISDEAVGILPDQTITRYNILGQVDYRLTGIGDGTPITSGRVSNFTSYSATSTTVATTAAALDARNRLMRILADQIVADLILTRGDWPA